MTSWIIASIQGIFVVASAILATMVFRILYKEFRDEREKGGKK